MERRLAQINTQCEKLHGPPPLTQLITQTHRRVKAAGHSINFNPAGKNTPMRPLAFSVEAGLGKCPINGLFVQLPGQETAEPGQL
jgi:hypothetical protein